MIGHLLFWEPISAYGINRKIPDRSRSQPQQPPASSRWHFCISSFSSADYSLTNFLRPILTILFRLVKNLNYLRFPFPNIYWRIGTMSSKTAANLLDVAIFMTALKFWCLAFPVFWEVLVYWICNLRPSACDKVPNPLVSAVTAVFMAYLVMEFAGLCSKKMGIISFSLLVWMVMIATSIWALVVVARKPLKGWVNYANLDSFIQYI